MCAGLRPGAEAPADRPRLQRSLGNNSETWRGVIERNGFKDLILSGFLFLDFCANHSLSVSQTSDTGGKMAVEHWIAMRVNMTLLPIICQFIYFF